MSKQLIHAYKSHVVIVALSDRAYAIVSDQKDPSLDARVIELLPPSVTLNDAKNDSTRQETNSTDFNEIQSVCCTEIDSRIWLAVSREDKTLSLYCTYATDDANEMRPLTIYNMPKRARCLLFNNVSSASLDRCRSIIIAGDLSGDAYAYPVSDSSRDSVVAVAKASRRLLLGHTASMLTGMQVVMSNTNAKQKFILTADRDEKVRVSVFPETHIIHGYLLGHSAFISTMDAVSKIGDDERSLCLTGSGDGTVRLWDYQSCKEVGMVPIVLRASNEHDNSELNDQEEINDCVQERKEDDDVEYDSDLL
jgi:tRNA (guanine-N(7)-)-methyltransferase subunit TRM82